MYAINILAEVEVDAAEYHDNLWQREEPGYMLCAGWLCLEGVEKGRFAPEVGLDGQRNWCMEKRRH